MKGYSVSQYAKHKGVSRNAVYKAIEEGRIKRLPDGSIDPVAADKMWRQTTRPRPDDPPSTDWVKDHDETAASSTVLRGRTGRTRGARAPGQGRGGAAAQSDAAPPGDAFDGGVPERGTSAARAEFYKAEKLRLELERIRGSLVLVEDVKRVQFEQARTIRDALLVLPDRLALELAALTTPHEVRTRLAEEIHHVLASLADAAGAAAAEARAPDADEEEGADDGSRDAA